MDMQTLTVLSQFLERVQTTGTKEAEALIACKQAVVQSLNAEALKLQKQQVEDSDAEAAATDYQSDRTTP